MKYVRFSVFVLTLGISVVLISYLCMSVIKLGILLSVPIAAAISVAAATLASNYVAHRNRPRSGKTSFNDTL